MEFKFNSQISFRIKINQALQLITVNKKSITLCLLPPPQLSAAELARLASESVLPHRTVDSIKSHLKTNGYKAFLGELARKRAEAQTPSGPIPDASRRSERDVERNSAIQHSPSPSRNSFVPEREEARDFEAEGALALEAKVRELSERLGVEIPTTVRDDNAQMLAWVPERGASRTGRRSPPASVPAPADPRRRRRREYAAFQTQWSHDRARVAKRV